MEAPERAWMIVDEDGDLVGYQAAREDLVEYIRADLAGLPDVDKGYGVGSCGNHCEACARRDDEITRLRAEVERLESEARASHLFHEGHEIQMTTLEAEVERLTKDLHDSRRRTRDALDDVQKWSRRCADAVEERDQIIERYAEVADQWASDGQRKHGNGGPAAAIRAMNE